MEKGITKEEVKYDTLYWTPQSLSNTKGAIEDDKGYIIYTMEDWDALRRNTGAKSRQDRRQQPTATQAQSLYIRQVQRPTVQRQSWIKMNLHQELRRLWLMTMLMLMALHKILKKQMILSKSQCTR